MTNFEIPPAAVVVLKERDVLKDMLEKFRKLVRESDGNSHVQPIDGLVSNCIVAYTPTHLHPTEIAFVASLVLRAIVERLEKRILFRWDVYLDALVIGREHESVLLEMTDADLRVDVLNDPRVANTITNMLMARTNHRQGKHKTT